MSESREHKRRYNQRLEYILGVDRVTYYTVTHWRPLPEPPKEGE